MSGFPTLLTANFVAPIFIYENPERIEHIKCKVCMYQKWLQLLFQKPLLILLFVNDEFWNHNFITAWPCSENKIELLWLQALLMIM